MNRIFHALVVMGVLMAGVSQASAQATKSDAKAEGKPTVVVNINIATAADFEALPGIGKATATRIVDYRQKNGPFKKIEELMNVQGIGEKSFLKLRAQLSVAAKPDAGRAQQ